VAHGRIPVAVLVAVLVVGAGLATPAPSRAAAADPEGAELMRLTNLDRVALGRPALTIDATLAALARDLEFTCPGSGATIRGRARDMADRDYFAHDIKGCTKVNGTAFGALDEMLVLGYATTRGENIAWNDYPSSSVSYRPGCDANGGNCTGAPTSTLWTVAIAQSGFMGSAGHRANILASYDRFGCGHASTTAGDHYYACLFSRGGSSKANDVTRPVFERLAGTRALTAGHGRIVSARVRDDVALASLRVTVDGRLVRAWTVSGTAAARSATVPARLLGVGRHRIRWIVRDRAGNSTSRSFWLVVRRR
jgi:uncharacterized protein YkwD